MFETTRRRHVCHRGNEQVGLANVNNLAVEVCDLNADMVGVQVPVEEVANGASVPVASPGSSDAIGATPENCASGSLMDGGTVQSN